MASTSVKAWTYTTAGYPSTLQLMDNFEVPKTPAPKHILVEIKAAALNPVDIQLMNLPLFSLPIFGLSSPKIVGRDFAGVVLAAAPGTGFEIGDEVMGVTMNVLSATSGSLAQITHVNVQEQAAVIRKPAHLSWAQAAALPLAWLTAMTALEKCAPFVDGRQGKAQRRVAVLGGSSATGMYMIYLARQRGWEVLTSCSSRNADFVRHRGACEVVDYTRGHGVVADAVKNFKPDAIMDCVGGSECIGLAAQYVSIVGDKTSRASLGGSALYLTSPTMWLRWFLGYIGVGRSYECISLETKADWLEKVANLQADDVIVDSTFGFLEAEEAFAKLDTAKARGKIVVETSV